jgi:antibiotic biosynthesis monooxygenase (ABM) superfamily enzyme
MLHLTQLFYVKPGGEAAFEQFEAIVIPLLATHRGELVLRLRLGPGTQIGGSAEPPYELHIVRFASAADFEAYLNDPVRQQWLHLKDQGLERAVVLRSHDE